MHTPPSLLVLSHWQAHLQCRKVPRRVAIDCKQNQHIHVLALIWILLQNTMQRISSRNVLLISHSLECSQSGRWSWCVVRADLQAHKQWASLSSQTVSQDKKLREPRPFLCLCVPVSSAVNRGDSYLEHLGTYTTEWARMSLPSLFTFK